MKAPKKQIEKFKKVARDLECAEDESRFEQQLREIVKAKPPTPPKTSRKAK